MSRTPRRAETPGSRVFSAGQAFLFLAPVCAVLSYASLGPLERVAIFVLALALPYGLWVRARLRAPSRTLEVLDRDPGICLPAWGAALILAAAWFVRFHKLTTLSNWPILDEAQFNYYSALETPGGNWRAFYGFQQAPPAFNWLMNLVYRVWEPSLAVMWGVSAFISFLTVLAGVWAVRAWGRPWASPTALLLLSFSYCTLYTGRFGLGMIATLLWEILALGFLGAAFRSAKGAAGLGIVLGLGCFLAPAWPWLAVVIAAPFLWRELRSKGSRAHGRAFLAGALPFVVAFAAMACVSGYGTYLVTAWGLKPGLNLAKYGEAILYYLAGPFFGVEAGFAYGPSWGGLFNAAVTALILVGAAEALASPRHAFTRWIFPALFLLCLPGLVTAEKDMFRVQFAWPILLLLAAAGSHAVLRTVSPGRRTLVAAAVFLAAALPDVHHLFGPYHRAWGNVATGGAYMKSSEMYRAYERLGREASAKGPGWILANLRPDTFDQSLGIAAYRFDASVDPRLSKKDVRWVAFLVNAHLEPRLRRAFPGGEWLWLGGVTGWPYGKFVLGIVPYSPRHRGTLDRWMQADRAMRPFVAAELNRRVNGSGETTLRSMARAYGAFKGDPLMESVYWEKAELACVKAGDNAAALQALERGLERGIPTAHFHYRRGLLLDSMGRTREARESFERAVRCRPDLTPSAFLLKQRGITDQGEMDVNRQDP